MSRRNPSPILQEGDRVRLITWSLLRAGVKGGFPQAVHLGDEGTIIFANNRLAFGGSHAVRWDNGGTSGAVRGCWLELIEKGREMKEGNEPQVKSEPVVEDLAESARRQKLTGAIKVAVVIQSMAERSAREQLDFKLRESAAVCDEAIARAWTAYDKDRT